MEDILNEVREATTILCAKFDQGELSEADRNMIKFALDLVRQGGLGDCLFGAALLCDIAENDCEQLDHLH